MPTWTVEAKYKLLLAMIATGSTHNHKWEEVAKAMGTEFNWNACRQQYQKIKREMGSELNMTTDGAEGGDGAPHTPKARGSKKGDAAEKATDSASGKRKKATKKELATNGDGESDDNEESPTKMVKKEDSDGEENVA